MALSSRHSRGAVRPLLVGVGITAATLMSTGTAQAYIVDTTTLTLATPRHNTVVASIANADSYKSLSCSVRGNGPTTFEFLNIRVAPRNTTTVTIADVPAGNYTISWGCSGFGLEPHLLTVGGAATTPAKPHIVPNDTVEPAPGGNGSLGSLEF
ncbi:hypothetical protein ERC79_09950 [Rhodococcus sp. ABRD24]|uniref:hypothetical protein n=1 Tax=Rhodococcus sp. ABRD24 TaxID=2507582 RepID=UPI00103E67E2|nr:hypothetical protein [Rhodococcus sp. ABRD24]QBJ96253.1 hypothetical protein ERC79_09950 [Rhodococcus sp. ABRD24]